MQYYAERNNFKNDNISLSLDKLKEYFIQIYFYFSRKDCFEAAFKGIYNYDKWSNEEIQLLPIQMSPSPQLYFLNHLGDEQIYPIHEFYESYTKEILFSVIEALYRHIGTYDYNEAELLQNIDREAFAEHINNILKFFDKGYYLEKKNGYIIEIPNEALKGLLSSELPKEMPIEVMDEFKIALKSYYKYDSSQEEKRAAIFILARILEGFRQELHEVLNKNFEVNKNVHDKLIFDILNNFDVRHNTKKQYSDYNRDIWFDWMMQYYASVILTYYKLKSIVE